MSGLEKTIKLLPLLSILIVTLGFIYYRAFYMSFGIRIVDYLELPEVLTLFLDELYILYGSIASFIVFYLSLYASSYRKTREREARKGSAAVEKVDSFSSRKDRAKERKLAMRKSFQSVLWRLLPPMITFGTASYLLVHKHLTLSDSIPIVLCGCYLGLVFGKYLFDLEILSRTRFSLLGGNQLQIVIFAMLTLSAAKASSQIKVNSIKEKHSNKDVDFVLDEALINSDTVCYYLGKTKNFLFYYDAGQHKATVYPMSRIKEISFTE